MIEASATGPAIVQLVTTQGRWEGTASELLTALSSNSYTEEKDRKRRDWPDNPQSMSNAVRRLAPALRASDIDVDFGRKAKRRRITLESSRNSSSFASSSSQTEFSGQKQGLLHDGRHDADDATANCLRHGDNGDSESETTIPSDDDANDANDARMRDSSGGHHSNDGDDWGTV
ncbi:MAG: hypothetical protein O7D91_10870 [Planctomycetota bacterium]|nr:hypothetical protein [Planctomycetota bacterium]